MMNKVRAFLLLFILAATALQSQQLENFIRDMYLQQKDDAQLFSDYQNIKAKLSSGEDLAYLEYYMARAWQSFDNLKTTIEHNRKMKDGKFVSLFGYYTAREKAVAHYESSLQIISKLPAPLSSEMIALKADSISQLCLLKSLGYTIVNGPKVKKLAKEALSKDPANIRAQMLIASSRIYPPRIYGGDAQEGIEMLKTISESQQFCDEDKYNIELGLAYCFARQNKTDQALAHVDQALEVYPTNVFAMALKEMISKKTF